MNTRTLLVVLAVVTVAFAATNCLAAKVDANKPGDVNKPADANKPAKPNKTTIISASDFGTYAADANKPGTNRQSRIRPPLSAQAISAHSLPMPINPVKRAKKVIIIRKTRTKLSPTNPLSRTRPPSSAQAISAPSLKCRCRQIGPRE